ncbi:MAG TPA: outer membrane lipid asymmetry maintenance protein MlaD [Rhizomicrobium sp.]|jgi:phospholipid/cholesterol/gamma-HCH transport system substrate-binding protein
MQNNTVETLIGAVVVIVAAVFLYFTYTATSSGSVSGYEIKARFAAVDGVNVGTDVRLHGIKVGSVSSLVLDPKSYMAVANLTIKSGIQIPEDSSAKITSSGILGSSYISISPGGSDTMMAANGELNDTQGAVDLMGLVGRYINGGSGSSSQKPSAPPQQTTPAPAPSAP